MLSCDTCHANSFVECICPEEPFGHQDDCKFSSLDNALSCKCCPEDHDHGAAANACPGIGNQHDADCPVGPACTVLTEAGEECPGGHCHKDVKGCTVCRPMTITLLPGSVNLKPAGV